MQIIFFRRGNGQEPVKDWLQKLAKKDPQIHDQILARLKRIEITNNLGDIKTVSGPVSELRIHSGPGYRVYCAVRGETLMILLCAGNKSSQASDIKKAREYWNEYDSRNNP